MNKSKDSNARRRSAQLFGMVAVCCFCATIGQANETGTVRFQGLQDNSLVYVDGKSVEVKNNTVTLPVGTHQLQIEQFRSPQEIQLEPQNTRNLTGVYVFRSCLVLKNTQTLTIDVKPLPVYPTASATIHSSWSSTAPPGPMGPMGLPGATADQTQETAYSLLREAILGDFPDVWQQLRMAHAERPLTDSYTSLAQNHWYGSAKGLTKVNHLICAPGPPGRPGPAGVTGNLLRLKDAQGHALLQLGRDSLNLAQWKREIQQTQTNRVAYRPARIEEALQPVAIYTERWKNHLDAEFVRFSFLKAEQKPASIGLPVGPMGRDGPRGPDGKLPANAAAIVFSDEEVKGLLARLQADPKIKEQINQLQASIDRLKAPSITNQKTDCENANPR